MDNPVKEILVLKEKRRGVIVDISVNLWMKGTDTSFYKKTENVVLKV